MHVYGYRNPNHGQRGFFLAPLVGGLIGGFVGGAFGGAISRPYGGFPGPYGGYPGAFGAYPGAYGPFPPPSYPTHMVIHIINNNEKRQKNNLTVCYEVVFCRCF